jgi:predicted alpha/beta superfamily hydrolase
MSRRALALAGLALILTTVGATLIAMDMLREDPPVEGQQVFSLESTVLGERRDYTVNLPAAYETGTRYPVLYVLDGDSQTGHTVDTTRLLARIGVVPPMIVIGIPNGDGERRNRDYTPPGMRRDEDAENSAVGGADHYLEFLRTELVPDVERRYRTVAPRMLAGWSRGGLFAVYAWLTAPSLFDAHFALSPALWRDSHAIARDAEKALTAGAPPGAFLYLSLGDGEAEDMMAAFRDFATVLETHASPALRWRADFTAGGIHSTNPRLSTPVGLCTVFRGNGTCQGPGVTTLQGSEVLRIPQP